MNHGDTEDTESFEYQVVDTTRCLFIGLDAMIRQRKFFGGENKYGNLPFNLYGIPMLSAIYEGMIREIVIAKIESEYGNGFSYKDANEARHKAEHEAALCDLNISYKELLGNDFFDVLNSKEKMDVCRSLNAMTCLRNTIIHGKNLMYPDEKIPKNIDGGHVKVWEKKLEDKVSKYFMSIYKSSHVIDVLKEYDVLKDEVPCGRTPNGEASVGFIVRLKILARALQEKHKDLGVQILGLILNYKYGKSNSL